MRNKNNKDASALEERFISEEVQVEEIDVDRAFKGKRRRYHGSQRHLLQDPLVGDPLHKRRPTRRPRPSRRRRRVLQELLERHVANLEVELKSEVFMGDVEERGAA